MMDAPGRLIGLDHGLVRIGVAVSDATRLVARELEIITRTSKKEDFARINQIAEEQQAVGFILGIPIYYEATDVDWQAQRLRNWATALQETTPLPIVLWDERLSSIDAAELAKQKRRHPRDPVDDLAARVILQSYLDALRDGLAPPPDHSTL